jgi:hypothetical protein
MHMAAACFLALTGERLPYASNLAHTVPMSRAHGVWPVPPVAQPVTRRVSLYYLHIPALIQFRFNKAGFLHHAYGVHP